jgi:hypothetical protein
MIPLQYLWQNHSGAAHRKNVDTPSLPGCRYKREPFTYVYAALPQRVSDIPFT